MIELPLAVAGGLLGSAHCVGMCGGFVLTLGSAAGSWRDNVVRQFGFAFGRVFTYSALGAAVGYFGRRLITSVELAHAQAWLALAAGVLLVWQGLKATGLWPARRRTSTATRPACLRPGLLGTLLRTRGAVAGLIAGVLTGLLPCGLVYAFLALAAAAGTMPGGMAVMACFGLGTVPVLTSLGLGASLAGVKLRQRLTHAAAWCVLLTGAVSIARGAAAWSTPVAETPRCPLCSPSPDVPGSRTESAAPAITIPVTVNSTTNMPTP